MCVCMLGCGGGSMGIVGACRLGCVGDEDGSGWYIGMWVWGWEVGVWVYNVGMDGMIVEV